MTSRWIPACRSSWSQVFRGTPEPWYNQADIRELEIPARPYGYGLLSLSSGARRFTRYGYADFFQEGSRSILFRLWPGTQRHLLSGDPEMAAAFGRTSHFCGAAGSTSWNRSPSRGGKVPASRAAARLRGRIPRPQIADWKKFEYYYRVWGRRLYDPDADPETWRRYLTSDFGPGALVENALANAGRVLPLVTSAHLPSAANHAFWPEIYDNMPIVLGSERSPYGDTPTPKCFGTVSPLDPQLFSLSSNTPETCFPVGQSQVFADRSGPMAGRLHGSIRSGPDQARVQATSHTSPEFRRMEEDVLIQNGLGRFFEA